MEMSLVSKFCQGMNTRLVHPAVSRHTYSLDFV